MMSYSMLRPHLVGSKTILVYSAATRPKLVGLAKIVVASGAEDELETIVGVVSRTELQDDCEDKTGP